MGGGGREFEAGAPNGQGEEVVIQLNQRRSNCEGPAVPEVGMDLIEANFVHRIELQVGVDRPLRGISVGISYIPPARRGTTGSSSRSTTGSATSA